VKKSKLANAVMPVFKRKLIIIFSSYPISYGYRYIVHP